MRFDSRRQARRNGDEFAGAIAGRFADASADRCKGQMHVALGGVSNPPGRPRDGSGRKTGGLLTPPLLSAEPPHGHSRPAKNAVRTRVIRHSLSPQVAADATLLATRRRDIVIASVRPEPSSRADTGTTTTALCRGSPRGVSRFGLDAADQGREMRVLTFENMAINLSAAAFESLTKEVRSLKIEESVTEFAPLFVERSIAWL